MTNLLSRRTKLIMETPYTERGRAVVAEVLAHGLSLRLKGKRHRLEISWGQIWTRAAIVTADKARAERAAKRKGKK